MPKTSKVKKKVTKAKTKSPSKPKTKVVETTAHNNGTAHCKNKGNSRVLQERRQPQTVTRTKAIKDCLPKTV